MFEIFLVYFVRIRGAPTVACKIKKTGLAYTQIYFECMSCIYQGLLLLCAMHITEKFSCIIIRLSSSLTLPLSSPSLSPSSSAAASYNVHHTFETIVGSLHDIYTGHNVYVNNICHISDVR